MVHFILADGSRPADAWNFGTLLSEIFAGVLADNPTIGYLAARTNVQYEG